MGNAEARAKGPLTLLSCLDEHSWRGQVSWARPPPPRRRQDLRSNLNSAGESSRSDLLVLRGDEASSRSSSIILADVDENHPVSFQTTLNISRHGFRLYFKEDSSQSGAEDVREEGKHTRSRQFWSGAPSASEFHIPEEKNVEPNKFLSYTGTADVSLTKRPHKPGMLFFLEKRIRVTTKTRILTTT